MGCCHNKELYIVCSWDWNEGAEFREDEHFPRGSASNASFGEEEKRPGSLQVEADKGPPLPPPPGTPPANSRISTSPATPSSKAVSSAQVANLPAEEPSNAEEGEPMPRLRPALHLTGNFANWEASFAPSRLQQIPAPDSRKDVARLKLCVKLTSQSFSFQVVSAEKGWSWRLYPRDAKPIRFTHVSKEGKMTAGDPDAVVVALGDLKAGHGLNFHVVEQTDVIVTVWIEVPTKPSKEPGLVEPRYDTAAGARVWYTVEDTGIQYIGGDGVDLERYKWMTG